MKVELSKRYVAAKNWVLQRAVEPVWRELLNQTLVLDTGELQILERGSRKNKLVSTKAVYLNADFLIDVLLISLVLLQSIHRAVQFLQALLAPVVLIHEFCGGLDQFFMFSLEFKDHTVYVMYSVEAFSILQVKEMMRGKERKIILVVGYIDINSVL